MAKIEPPRKPANARRLLHASWFCLAIGAALYAAALLFAQGTLRALAPWVMYVGVILLFLHIAVRTNSAPRGARREEDAINAFGQSTTMFLDGQTKPAPVERPARKGDEQETEI